VKAEADPNCQKDEEVFADCLIRARLEPRNVNPVSAAAIADTVQAAKALMDEMTAQYSVDPVQVYVVGSSGVAQAAHKDALRSALENGLNKPGQIGFVTADEEGRYGFQGVINLIPKEWRERRRQEALLMDIGSGNTKGAYMEVQGGRPQLTGFEIPWGVKTFSDEVDRQRGAKPFKDVSAQLRGSLLRPATRELVGRKPGMALHNRVYLIGGIPWALTTLVQPANKQHFPRIYPAQFDTLYTRAVAPNATQRLCAANPERRVNPDIEKVCQVYTVENLIAGMDLLKTFSEEMKFGEKTLFFMRDSLYAWPLGYLKARCQKEGKC
jgi:hypothetical protein